MVLSEALWVGAGTTTDCVSITVARLEAHLLLENAKLIEQLVLSLLHLCDLLTCRGWQ